ncbi:MAG: carboxypeptidase regulatory-like domain-containing protein [Acidobacteria bacterium]|nr:carboxypeptidase regulatory-like domain-containing protein [Acidobacteriota bacterium]
MNNWLRLAFTLALLATVSTAVWGQTAAVTGTVRDTSGAIVPGAPVVLRNIRTGIVDRSTSNAEGIFVFPRLKVGQYQLQIEQGGFKMATTSEFDLMVSEVRNFDIRLEIGATQEKIQVTDQAPLVKAETAETGEVITERTMREIPLNGRNYLQLATLTPGVVPGTGGDNRSGQSSFSVGGARTSGNSFLLDGSANNDEFTAGYASTPSLDTIQEFKIQTSQYSAVYGRAEGGVVNVVTKSGSNQLHGTAYEFLRNDKMDARSFFDQARIPPLRRNEYGFTLGGPIRRDRTFFFGGYEAIKTRRAASSYTTIPDPTQLKGDFSKASYLIYDPLNAAPDPANPAIMVRQPFAGNTIAPSRISKVAAKLGAFFPAPNYSQTGSPFNYFSAFTTADEGHREMVRVDHRFSDNRSVYGRFNTEHRDAVFPGIFPNKISGATTQDPSVNTMLVWTETLSPTLVNEARFAYNHYRHAGLPAVPTDFTSQIGLVVPFLTPDAYGMPRINIQNLTGLRLAANAGAVLIYKQNMFTWADQLHYISGKHSIAVGADIMRLQNAQFQSDAGGGQITFSGQYTASRNGQFSPNGLADFLLGNFSSTQARASLDFTRGFRTFIHPYFEDDIKVNSRLTLNLGLRYELNSRWSEAQSRMGNFDLTTGERLIPTEAVPWIQSVLGVNPVSKLPFKYRLEPAGRVLPDYGKRRLAPRIGLAYRLNESGTTVLRGGYGIFYGFNEANLPTNMGIRIPWHTAIALTGAAAVPSTSLDVGIGTPGNVISSLIPPATAPYAPRSLSEGYSHKFSFSVSQQLVRSMVLDVSYIGSVSRNLLLNGLLNLPDPAPGDIQSRRQFRDVLLINTLTNDGTADHHALQASVNKRLSHGLSFLGAYTFSKTLDNKSDGDNFPLDSRRLDRGRGLADFNRKHASV